MAIYPSLEQLIQSKNPLRLLVVHRSPRSLLSLIFVFVLSILVVYVLTLLFLKIEGFISAIPYLNSFTPRILAVIPVLLLLEIVRRVFNDRYIFGTHRLTHLKGRFSLSYQVPVIKLIDIRAINVIQDFWGRILDYGDIDVGTAAHEDSEIYVKGVRAPQELAKLLDQLRSNSLKVSSKEINQAVDTSMTD